MRCKSGDIAFLNTPANYGVVVECLRIVPDVYPGYACPIWEVKLCGPAKIISFDTGRTNIMGAGYVSLSPDSALTPISGVPVEDEVSTEEPCYAFQ